MKRKRVALYVRVSTSEQSVEPQLLDLRRQIAERGWELHQEFRDEGISGTRDRRPALDRLMDEARKHRFDIVLVWRFDRFARSTRHLILAMEEFCHLGIDFVSFQENIDTGSPLGKAIFTIISAVAQLERDIIAERVRAGLRAARERGKRLGRPSSRRQAERRPQTPGGRSFDPGHRGETGYLEKHHLPGELGRGVMKEERGDCNKRIRELSEELSVQAEGLFGSFGIRGFPPKWPQGES